jgi:hypothetical protein
MITKASAVFADVTFGLIVGISKEKSGMRKGEVSTAAMCKGNSN